ncbi:unnamed protein product [Nippostrongylus brasiliensis]|uniref:Uncharacterized protein n=1 Tax=Nippostrongylus brasiliensis TaxID=27835 RepID=A0A0N4XKA8_NIPBR|nr:unnamed protein product [Nippostrongylus brasiliensis]
MWQSNITEEISSETTLFNKSSVCCGLVFDHKYHLRFLVYNIGIVITEDYKLGANNSHFHDHTAQPINAAYYMPGVYNGGYIHEPYGHNAYIG